MARWWLGLGLVLTVAAAAPPTDEELAALFPKPPATVVARLEVDLRGDGQPSTAVLYRGPFTDPYRLALITRDATGKPQLLAENLKTTLAQNAPELAARDLTGDGRPELLVTGGYGPHGVAYQVFTARDSRLLTLLSLTDQAPTQRLEVDLDGDGRREIVHVTGNHYVWAYACHLSDWRLDAYTWDGNRFVLTGWRAPASGPAQALTQRLQAYAAAHLWRRAVDTAEEAARAEPSPATRWNQWLAETTAELFYEQQADHRAATTPQDRVVSAVADALAGDYAATAATLRGFAGPDTLPAGWETPFRALKPILEQALAVEPELAGERGVQFVRALVLLATDDPEGARTAFARARSGAADDLSSWLAVGRPGARLYYLGPDEHLRWVDVSPRGELAGPLHLQRAIGPLRSVTGCPSCPAFAYVPEAGNRVVRRGADGESRTLVTGEFLYLRSDALSPDGRFLAVDSGTGSIRRLELVEFQSGHVEATLTYAGGFAWAPDSRALALEVPVRVEPPLPWEDGATRGLQLVDPEGATIARLASGDSNSVWSIEGWSGPHRLLAALTRLRRRGGTTDTIATAVEHYAIDTATRQRQPAPGRSRADLDRALVARRTKLAPDAFDVPEGAWHPRFLLYRKVTPAGADLYLLAREGGEPHRLGNVPPLDQPLVASWGGLPTGGEQP